MYQRKQKPTLSVNFTWSKDAVIEKTFFNDKRDLITDIAIVLHFKLKSSKRRLDIKLYCCYFNTQVGYCVVMEVAILVACATI